MANFQTGDLITFSYPAVFLQGTKAHLKYPQVLVLHPRWDLYPKNNPRGNYLLHGLTFNYLTPDEKNMIRMILDPSFEEKYRPALTKKNIEVMRKFDAIMSKASGATIANPHDFYTRVIEPFILPKGWDPYRLYNLKKMTNIRILQRKQYLEGRSVFGKYAKNSQAAVPAQPGLAPRPPMRLPAFRRPGALPGTEEK